VLPDIAKKFRSIEAMFRWRTPKPDVLKYVIASSSAAFAKHASDEGGSSVPIPELEVAGGDLQTSSDRSPNNFPCYYIQIQITSLINSHQSPLIEAKGLISLFMATHSSMSSFSLQSFREHMEKLRQALDGVEAQLRDHKQFFAYEDQCRLRAFIKQTTKDLVAIIESHHELRVEAYGSVQHSHVVKNILPVHLGNLGIPYKYWTSIEQVKEAKQSPYIQVGNKLRQRYKFEKREKPYEESPRQFAHLLRSDRFKETDVCNYWAPLFPMLYKKTVEELEEEYISSLSSWKISYPPV